MKLSADDLAKRGYHQHPDGSWSKTRPLSPGVPSPAVSKSNPQHDNLAEEARARLDVPFRLVRITSYRVRLCDETNIWSKHLVDALVVAGVLRDDAPAFAKVLTEQIKVDDKSLERTEIQVYQ